MARLQNLSHVHSCDWKHPRKIGHNTKAWSNSDGFSIRYHYTNVVSFDAATQTLHVSHAGYMTKTTAERIRHGLSHIGLQLLTRDLPNVWRVADYNGNAWTIYNNSVSLVRVNKEWQRNDKAH